MAKLNLDIPGIELKLDGPYQVEGEHRAYFNAAMKITSESRLTWYVLRECYGLSLSQSIYWLIYLLVLRITGEWTI